MKRCRAYFVGEVALTGVGAFQGRWCQPACKSQLQSTQKQGRPDGLTVSLMRLSASQRRTASVAYAHGNEERQLLPTSYKNVAAPRLLHVLLLKCRQKTAKPSILDVEAVPEVSMLAGAQRDADESGGKWHAAFRLFSEAIQRRGVLPNIAHINVLLGITVRERRWPQKAEVEKFVERFLEAAECMGDERREYLAEQLQTGAKGNECTVDDVSIQQLITAMRPTAETYEWLMEAAVRQRDWEAALTYFGDARAACLPISDLSLRLSLRAYRIAGVHSIFKATKRDRRAVQMMSLRTDQRGPALRSSAAPASLRGVANAVRVESEDVRYVWQAALSLFESYKHRVHEGQTIGLFMTMMTEAGQYQQVIRTHSECHRTLIVDEDVLLTVSRAARELGDWVLSLRLLEESSAKASGLPQSILENTVHTLRRTGHYREILLLHAQLPPIFWSAGAYVVLAQAAVVQRELPLLLSLLTEEEDRYEDTQMPHDVDTAAHTSLQRNLSFNVTTAASMCTGRQKQTPLEMFDVALRAIQVELIHRRCKRAGDSSTSTGSGSIGTGSGNCQAGSVTPRYDSVASLASLSVAIYEKFLHVSTRQLKKWERDNWPSGSTLTIYAPLLKLLAVPLCENHTVVSTNKNVRGSPCAPWEVALAHVALIRRPDAPLICLAAHLLQRYQQWEAAFKLLSHVEHNDELAQSAAFKLRCALQLGPSRASASVEPSSYRCTIISATSVRYAVLSAAAHRPAAALHLVQYALAHSWIDSGMALQLLQHIQRNMKEPVQRRTGGRQATASNSHIGMIGGETDSYTLSCDAIVFFKEFVSLWSQQSCVVAPLAPLFNEILIFLQRGPHTDPSISSFTALCGSIANVLRRLSTEWKVEQHADVELALVAAVHATVHHVGASTLSRRALWSECLCLVQLFHSPLIRRTYTVGVLEVNEATFRVLRTFISNCNRSEEAFVEGIAFQWLLPGKVLELPQLEEIFRAPGGLTSAANASVWWSLGLLLYSLVWASRLRSKELVRHFVGVLLPLLQRLLQNEGNCTIISTSVSPREIRSDGLAAAVVAVQCLTSGAHEEVLHDWPHVYELLSTLLQVPELTATEKGEGNDVSTLADVLGAVLDKLRRSFHFLIRGVSLNKGYRTHCPKGPTTPASDRVKEHGTAEGNSSGEVVERSAFVFLDICEELTKRLSVGTNGERLVRNGITSCLDKVMNCIWDVGYALFVWRTLFSGYPNQVNAKVLQQLQSRYHRALYMQMLHLPVQHTTPSILERWLVVMSGCGRNGGTTRTHEESHENRLCAAIINDITTLDAWASCRSLPHEPGAHGRESRGREPLLIVPMVLRVINSITQAAMKRFSQCKLSHTKTCSKSWSGLLQLGGGRDVHSLFEDHLLVTTIQQLQTLQEAGSALVYMMLCEGNTEVLQMAPQIMSWYFCPRTVMNAVVHSMHSASPDVLKPLWKPEVLVAAFEALGVQSRMHAAEGISPPRLCVGSQASLLLSLLTSSSVVRAVARMDEEVIIAALLSLEAADLERSDNAQQTAHQLLVAFPKILERQLVSMLLRGHLGETQLHALDVIVERTASEVRKGSGTCSPALTRGAAMWMLLRRPSENRGARADGYDGLVESITMEERIFCNIMIFCGSQFEVNSCRAGAVQTQQRKRKQPAPREMRARNQFIPYALEWEQALKLLTDANKVELSDVVDVNGAFLDVIEMYGACVPMAWKVGFAEELLSHEAGCDDRHKGEVLPKVLVRDVARELLHCRSFAPGQPVDDRELYRVGLKIWSSLSTRRGALVQSPPSGVWNLVWRILNEMLRNRSHVHGRPAGLAEVSVLPFSLCVVERAVTHILRCGVRWSLLPGEREDIPTVAASLLLMLELIIPCRSLRLALFESDNITHEEGSDAPGCVAAITCEENSTGEHAVWSTLLSFEVLLLTLPGLLDGSSGAVPSCAAAKGQNALDVVTTLPKMLLYFACRHVSHLTSLGEDSARDRSGAAQEELGRLIELCGWHIASFSSALLTDSIKGEAPSTGKRLVLETAVKNFVRAALLMGAWRDIYWLAFRILACVKTLFAHGGRASKHPQMWGWVVGLLPAMVVASARTSSSIQVQVSTLIKEVPLDLLRLVPYGEVPTVNGLDNEEEVRIRQGVLSVLLRQVEQSIWLKTEEVLRERGRSLAFADRLSAVKPLVQLGMHLEVWKGNGARASSFLETLLFFLSERQFKLLCEASRVENRSKALSVRAVSPSERLPQKPEMTWEEALTLLLRSNRAEFCSFLQKSSSSSKSTTPKLHNALSIFKSSHISCCTPWWAAITLFCRSDGPPHVIHVFPAFFSERVIERCPSWKTALRALQHSLSTVPHTTRVQQYLVYLILRRLRTDPTWAIEESYTSAPTKLLGEHLSWQTACWCYDQLARKGKGAPPIQQRTMTELLRHCVLNPEATLSMYEVYWAQGYNRAEGVNSFLSLLRAGRRGNSEKLVLRAMRDYIKQCDEWNGAQCNTQRRKIKSPPFTAEGNATLCRAFLSVCSGGIVSQQARTEVAAALKQRGCIGEVEELLIVSGCSEGARPRDT